MKIAVRPISRYVIIAAALLAAAFYLAPRAGAQQGVVTADNPETRPPVLSIVQNNTALSVVASDDNLDSNTWQAAGPFAQEPVCDSDGLVYGPADPGARFLTLTPADNGQWYCFKVGDTDGNYGYAKFEVIGVTVEEEPVEEVEEIPEPEVESEPLVISASQSGSNLTVIVNRENYAGEIQILIVSGAGACNGESFDRSSRSVFTGRQVSGLSWRDNGKHYCFRTADNHGGYVYAQVEVSGLAVPAAATASEEEPAVEDGEEEPGEADGEPAGDSEEEAGTAEGDGDEEEGDDALRLVGIVVAVVGIVAIVAVILFSRRQAEQNIEDSDDDF